MFVHKIPHRRKNKFSSEESLKIPRQDTTESIAILFVIFQEQDFPIRCAFSKIIQQDKGVFSAQPTPYLEQDRHPLRRASIKLIQGGYLNIYPLQALPLLSKLTSLDLHGDTWERTPLTLKDIGHLQHLTDLRHLGLHHYELEGGIKDFTGGMLINLVSSKLIRTVYAGARKKLLPL